MSAPTIFVLPVLAGGGAERVAVELSRALADVDVHFALFERRVGYAARGPIHRLAGNFVDPGPLGRRALRAAATVAALTALRARLRPSVSLSFTLFPNLVNVMAGGPGRRVVSAHSHESAIRGTRLESFLRPLVTRNYVRADDIVAVSESVAQDLVDFFRIPADRITVIHNGVDLTGIEHAASEPIEPELEALFDRPVVVTTGRLVPVKGHWQVLGAWRDVVARAPGARLVIVGDGHLRDDLARTARAAGLTTWSVGDRQVMPADVDVAFLGFRENPFNVMARADAFVLPSIREGFGNALIEAMALGLPVIANACAGGPAEILGSSGGRVVDVERAPFGILVSGARDERLASSDAARAVERAWADAIVGVLSSPRNREELRALSLARVSTFSLERSADRWRAVLVRE